MLEHGCQHGRDEVLEIGSGVVLDRWCRNCAPSFWRRLVKDFEPNIIVHHHSHLDLVSRRLPGPPCALTMLIKLNVNA